VRDEHAADRHEDRSEKRHEIRVLIDPHRRHRADRGADDPDRPHHAVVARARDEAPPRERGHVDRDRRANSERRGQGGADLKGRGHDVRADEDEKKVERRLRLLGRGNDVDFRRMHR
jgi:hypothetical protein